MIGRRRLLVMVAASAGLLLGASWPVPSRAATLSVTPFDSQLTTGQTLTLTVKLDADAQAINAAEGTISWSSDILRLTSISRNGSIFSYWPIEPAVDDRRSVIFSGGLPSPGFDGPSGTIVRLTFTAIAAGSGVVQIDGAKVLANDGSGTDVLTAHHDAMVTVTGADPEPAPPPSPGDFPAPVISSNTHPSQSTWYDEYRAELSWTTPVGYRGASYVLTADPNSLPDDERETTGSTATVTMVGDGNWYFHVRAEYTDGWSGTAHYALHVDRTPPEPPTLGFDPAHGPESANPLMLITGRDATSGIASYTAAVDGGPSVVTDNALDLGGLSAGSHQVLVTASDRAGNSSQFTYNFAISGYPAPVITSVSSPLLLLDPIVIRGTAQAGDRVTVMIDGRTMGTTMAGRYDPTAQGITIRTPWTLTIEGLLQPGTYRVTATATSPIGQVSAPSGTSDIKVVGQAIRIGGRPFATLSVATPAVVLVLLLLVAILAVMIRLALAVRSMHRRALVAIDDVQTVLAFNERQSLSRQQVASAMVRVERDLEDRPGSRRRLTRRTTPPRRR